MCDFLCLVEKVLGNSMYRLNLPVEIGNETVLAVYLASVEWTNLVGVC